MTFIFDFDSTLVNFETLDVLAEISESNVEQIRNVTNQAMNGVLDFQTALDLRFRLLNLRVEHIEILKSMVIRNISPSVIRNKEFFANNLVYIVSGGFREIIYPVADFLSVPRDRVFANDFVYDDPITFEKSNPLANENGKQVVIKQMNITNGIMIGDGWTDWKVRESGLVDKFYAYTEIISRSEVLEVCDEELKSMDYLLRSIHR